MPAALRSAPVALDNYRDLLPTSVKLKPENRPQNARAPCKTAAKTATIPAMKPFDNAGKPPPTTPNNPRQTLDTMLETDGQLPAEAFEVGPPTTRTNPDHDPGHDADDPGHTIADLIPRNILDHFLIEAAKAETELANDPDLQTITITDQDQNDPGENDQGKMIKESEDDQGNQDQNEFDHGRREVDQGEFDHGRRS